MLVLTEEAADAIRGILEEAELGAGSGLRISAEAGGDGEAELDFAIAEAPLDGDVIVERDEVSVFLDELAAELLDDQALGVEAHGDHFHFSIDPQAEASD